MVDASNRFAAEPQKEHWLARWATLIAVVISVLAGGATFVAANARSDERLTAVEATTKNNSTRLDQDDEKTAKIQGDVAAIRQQSEDTNSTVHTILDTMMRK